MEIIEQNTDKIQIYTDGSKRDNQTGCGVYIPTKHYKKPIKLPDETSIFIAEAYAIITALNLIIANHIQNTIILSDSLSVITTLNTNNKNPYIKEIQQLNKEITQNNNSVQFTWIPSHCGLQGNEIVDTIAKQSLNDAITTQIPYTIESHNKEIRKYTKHIWQNQWNTHNNTIYYQIQPQVQYACQLYSKNRKLDTIYTSFILGNPPLNKYLAIINPTKDPNCQQCDTEETSEHFFLECNKYQAIRIPLINKIRANHLPETVKTILSHSEIVKHSIEFIIKSKRFIEE